MAPFTQIHRILNHSALKRFKSLEIRLFYVTCSQSINKRGDTDTFPKIGFHGRGDTLVIDTHSEHSTSAALHPGTYMVLSGQVMGKHSAKYLNSVNKLQFTSAQPYIGLGQWNWPFAHYDAFWFWWTKAESPFTGVAIIYINQLLKIRLCTRY